MISAVPGTLVVIFLSKWCLPVNLIIYGLALILRGIFDRIKDMPGVEKI